jgi:hypothetical protein
VEIDPTSRPLSFNPRKFANPVSYGEMADGEREGERQGELPTNPDDAASLTEDLFVAAGKRRGDHGYDHEIGQVADELLSGGKTKYSRWIRKVYKDWLAKQYNGN